jgi:hypothetical protein
LYYFVENVKLFEFSWDYEMIEFLYVWDILDSLLDGHPDKAHTWRVGRWVFGRNLIGDVRYIERI